MKYLLLYFLCILATAQSLFSQSDTQALAFLQQHHPTVHEKILSLKNSAPEDYQSALSEAKTAAVEYAKIQAVGDGAAASAYLKMYALDFQAVSLSDEILAAKDEATRETLTRKLRAVISDSFDQWVIVERARIKRLDAELDKVRRSLEEAVTNREQVIEADSQALLEESRSYQNSKAKKDP